MGSRLLELMYKYGFTTYESMANRFGVTHVAVLLWVAEERFPSEVNLLKMAKLFGPSDFYYLITGE